MCQCESLSKHLLTLSVSPPRARMKRIYSAQFAAISAVTGCDLRGSVDSLRHSIHNTKRVAKEHRKRLSVTRSVTSIFSNLRRRARILRSAQPRRSACASASPLSYANPAPERYTRYHAVGLRPLRHWRVPVTTLRKGYEKALRCLCIGVSHKGRLWRGLVARRVVSAVARDDNAQFGGEPNPARLLPPGGCAARLSAQSSSHYIG